MIIRKANKKDIDNGLLKVYIEGYKHHYNGRPDIFLNKSDDDLKEDLIKIINESNILVLDDNKVIGLIVYKIIDKFYETIDKFIHWICEKFDMGAEDNLIRDFQKETNTS